MEECEKELLKDFGKLLPENRNNILSLVRAVRSAQENTKKSMKAPATGKKPRVTA